MASMGTPISEIAKTLEAEKVLIPSAYTAKYHPEQNNNRTFKDPYRWRYGTISDIINRREYLGHTVLKKSERANFKMKNRKAVARENQLLFENTHEPIVSQEIWDKAQKFRQRARSKRVNPAGTFTEGHLLGGLVFCADCGSRMRAAVGGTDREHPYFSFRCGKHASDRRVCSSHNIGEVSLEKLVLTTIQKREEKRKAAMAENDGHLYPAKICEQCGKEYWPTRPSQKYCSKECGRAHENFVRMNRDPAEKEGHRFFKRQCVVCGKEFWPSGPNSICCSDECRKQRISIRKKENYDAVKRAAV